MIASRWNCQWMRTSGEVRALQDVLRQTKPDVKFLSDSHLAKAKAKKN
jgi:hypothetical protein